jgi:DNA adenine methylase
MILRYPGGKKKVAKQIAESLLSVGPITEYREPFCGSAAVAFAMLADSRFVGTVWLNDLDPGIAALWESVLHYDQELLGRVAAFEPTVESFKTFKASLLTYDPTKNYLSADELGFRKLAVHQMSFSGLGTRAGSPIGGWKQGPDNPKLYDVGCRWNPGSLAKNITKLHKLLVGRAKITCIDALSVIRESGQQVVLYVDPPYVGEGSKLYQYSYEEESLHKNLAAELKASNHKWLLSYDDHLLVRSLYSDCFLFATEWAYTINSQKDNSGSELVITNGMPNPFPKNEENLIEDLFGR